MKRVIIGRPRSGWSGQKPHRRVNEKGRRGYLGDWEATSSFEPINTRGRGKKDFKDHITPLEKFLHSKVGEPWDKIWSEICEFADERSTIGRHLREHAEGMVYTKCFLEDGKILAWKDIGIFEVRAYHYDALYVCPSTGILRVIPRVLAWKWR